MTILFNRALDSGYFKGFQTDPWYYITHLQYVYDTLIFLLDDSSSLLHVKRILRWFKIISSFKVNFYKNPLIGINLYKDYTLGLVNVIFYRSDSFPVRYPGLPLGANPSRLSSWKLMLSAIRAKLSTCKGNMLSMARRICLIKSILSSLSFICLFILCRRILLMSYLLLIALFCGVIVRILMEFVKSLSIRLSSQNLSVVWALGLCIIRIWLCSLNVFGI